MLCKAWKGTFQIPINTKQVQFLPMHTTLLDPKKKLQHVSAIKSSHHLAPAKS
jgi:hypothetical protein